MLHSNHLFSVSIHRPTQRHKQTQVHKLHSPILKQQTVQEEGGSSSSTPLNLCHIATSQLPQLPSMAVGCPMLQKVGNLETMTDPTSSSKWVGEPDYKATNQRQRQRQRQRAGREESWHYLWHWLKDYEIIYRWQMIYMIKHNFWHYLWHQL